VRWPWGKDSAETLRKAEILRELHWQCWREDAPPLETPLADLVDVLPVLIESGSVGLVWPRLWHRAEELGAVGAALQAAYESQVAHNARVEQRLAEAARRLQAEGIEPVIIKGWSVARLYPSPLVRPAGDLDLVVPDADFSRALDTLYRWAEASGEITIELHDRHHRPDLARQLHAPGVRSVEIDLHKGATWEMIPSPDVLAHAHKVPITNDIEIRVLRPEDALKQSIFHYLWHGGTRLLRLVDIALLMEAGGHKIRPYDWERILGDDEARATWVTATLGLAHRLLGARIDDTPAAVAGAAMNLPGWLVREAERQVLKNQQTIQIGFMDALSRPRQIPRMLRERWWDPISATVRSPLHRLARFDNTPRVLVQTAVYADIFARYGREDLIRQATRRLSGR
jgi:hypothetical protein